MQIKLLNQEEPYGEVICKYFSSTFPKVIVPNLPQLLDILTNIVVGDKNVRLGPIPNTESLVEIRKVISESIKNNVAIPILVAWGGVKTNRDAKVDIAEVAAISQLMRLDDSVKAYFKPGIKVNIRIEDRGAEWLYRYEDIIDKIEAYSEEFKRLVLMFAWTYDIKPIRESGLMYTNEYFETSKKYSDLLYNIISGKVLGGNVNSDMYTLLGTGWVGDLPMEQINHYISRYEILYPNKSTADYIKMAADYLGGAKARYDLDGRAEPAHKFISISFIPPIPGAPVSMFNNTLYYRTVYMKDCRTHIAPWRSKGYLEISSDNSVKAKITSWNNREIIDNLHKAEIEIIDEMDRRVIINADYLVKEVEPLNPFNLV